MFTSWKELSELLSGSLLFLCIFTVQNLNHFLSDATLKWSTILQMLQFYFISNDLFSIIALFQIV